MTGTMLALLFLVFHLIVCVLTWTGITAGAGMYMLAVLAALIMILMIILFYHKQQGRKIYIAVIHYTGDEAGG